MSHENTNNYKEKVNDCSTEDDDSRPHLRKTSLFSCDDTLVFLQVLICKTAILVNNMVENDKQQKHINNKMPSRCAMMTIIILANFAGIAETMMKLTVILYKCTCQQQ